MVILKKLVVIFTATIISQFQLNLSVLSVFTVQEIATTHVSMFPKKIGGGTINTEIDMRGNLHLHVNTDNPTASIIKVVVISSSGEEVVLEGCMLQKCSYNIEHLPLSVFYTATAITDANWSFSDSFQRK